MEILKSRRSRKPSKKAFPLFGFTLVELIVVITILAILATVGFLSLSGYSDDARSATVKANVRTVYSAILTESTTSGNSPRYYVSHDATAALSGAFVFVDGKQVALTGGNVGEAPADSNYSAGNPRWDRLRMNGDKFKLAFAGPGGFGGFGALGNEARAAYSTGELSVGAADAFKTGANGRKRATPYFQVAAVVPGSKVAVVTGNYAPGAGTADGLVRDPAATDASYSLMDNVPSTSTIPVDCKSIKAANPGATDGSYRIDPDGVGGKVPFQAYCDMSTDGGGWTLVGWNKGVSNAVGLSFFISPSNLTNAANKDMAASAASIGAETFSKQVGTTSAMLKSSAYSATPIIENGFGTWDYDVKKCTGTLNHTSRTEGCPGYNANDDWSSADKFNIAIGQNGIVPYWLAMGYEVCYNGRGWCDFEFFLR